MGLIEWQVNLLIDLGKMSNSWRFLNLCLFAVNTIGPLFLFPHQEALMALLCFCLIFFTMGILHRFYGPVRLLGAGQVYWVGFNAWLLMRYSALEPGLLQTWALIVIALNTFSLLVNSMQVMKYLFGDKRPMV
jgi:hypothetical protein